MVTRAYYKAHCLIQPTVLLFMCFGNKITWYTIVFFIRYFPIIYWIVAHRIVFLSQLMRKFTAMPCVLIRLRRFHIFLGRFILSYGERVLYLLEIYFSSLAHSFCQTFGIYFLTLQHCVLL